jgi:SAM-dependent methyltransferase
MNFKGVEICCPRCLGDLRWVSNSYEQLACLDCHSDYPVICDIPDLRVFPDPYIDIEADRDKGRGLATAAQTRDFPALIDYYYASTSVVPAKQAQQFKRGLLAAGARASAALAAWETEGSPPRGRRLLEIGCGTGPLLIAAQQKGYQAVGVDIAFRWLIVGRKRLESAGIDVPLICACAEALPFSDSGFDRVVLDSVIEHVRDQDKVLAQCHRVAVPQAALYLATPNRFSIGPDPHTGIPAGSLLPATITATLVKRQGGIPPRRQLLSVFALRRKLAQAGFKQTRVFLPDVPDSQRAHVPRLLQLAISTYHLLKRLPVSRHLLFLIGPLLYAVAERNESESGQPDASL